MKKIINNSKKVLGTLLIAIIAGVLAVLLYSHFFQNESKIITQTIPYSFTKLPARLDSNIFDFSYAAEKTVNAVVHVKTKSKLDKGYSNPLYEFFYGDEYKNREPVVGYGSGVIITADGYIVSNNHVIEHADEIMVTLNDKREFSAELIGSDPQTDIALLKVEAEDLPFVHSGNSDRLKVGEWVLAVGNPYNLTSTVTAGIVSAKGRNLNILDDKYRIESFIQTDAAVNRGNSGGALVDFKGELVGINTAIISPSGAYSGNSFAVPINIVKKVVEDLIEYGTVQRAILGVTIQEVTAEIAEDNKLEKIYGVYVAGTTPNGAAQDAGIKKGDIILSVDEVKVNSTPELQEQVSRHRPNDEVKIIVIRGGKKKHFDVVLRNMYGDTEIVRSNEKLTILGAVFEGVDAAEKSKLRIEHGVKISELDNGKFKSAGIKENFIITHINNKPVQSIADVKQAIDNIDGGVYIEGVYPNGMKAYYAFGK